eukprot:7686739-Pyramimonas_sp.AAC.1
MPCLRPALTGSAAVPAPCAARAEFPSPRVVGGGPRARARRLARRERVPVPMPSRATPDSY